MSMPHDLRRPVAPIATVHDIAKVCHEANRAYCAALGYNSQPAWEDAPDWQKESAIAGVRLHVENPEADASASHESWMAQKVAEGWVYGPRKDPVAKRHPCMVPFEELPFAQQLKDHLFRSIVHAIWHTPIPPPAVHEEVEELT